MLDEDIRSWILSDAVIVSQLGVAKAQPAREAADQRVAYDKLKQGSGLAAITFVFVSGHPDMAHSGPVGIQKSRYSFSVYAYTIGETRALLNALRNRLIDFKPGGVQSLPCFSRYARNTTTEPEFHRWIIDMYIWHRQDA